MKNVPHMKKLILGMIAASLLVCGAAFALLLPPAAPEPKEPAAEPANPLYLNSVEPVQADCPLLEDPHTYICGALLYQSPAISSYFSDGGSLGAITRHGGILTVTDEAGASQSFSLAEARTYSTADFRQQFALAGGEWEAFSALLPEGAERITHFTYANAGPSEQPQTLDLWEAASAGSGSRLWMGDIAVRLYALIDLYEALPFFANGALWTYDPQASTAVPVRFDLDGPVTVTAGSLSGDLTGERTGEMTVDPGETVYWWPAGEGTVLEGAALQYCWDGPSSGGETCRETLEFRSVMHYEGLYGCRTYGVSNNWLGAASSAIHPSALCVDAETGELVIECCENGPYATGIHGAHCVRGRHTPPEVIDASDADNVADTAHHHREEHLWKHCS